MKSQNVNIEKYSIETTKTHGKKKNSFVDKVKIKEKIMTQLEIDNIDHIVQSWKFSMCVICANNCMAKSLYDLSLSSEMCHRKGHEVPCRTSILKGYGNLKAAVEYIYALRKYHCNEHYEARYHAQNAIKISKRFEDNLNLNIRKLGLNILEKLKTGKRNDKTFTYFTLSELIVFSNKNKNYKSIKNSIGNKNHTTNIEYLNNISHRSLCNKNTVFKDDKNKHNNCNKILVKPLETRNLIRKNVGKIGNVIKQSTPIAKTKLMLLGGINKRKRKRIDYAKLNNSGFEGLSKEKVENVNEKRSAKKTKRLSTSISHVKKEALFIGENTVQKIHYEFMEIKSEALSEDYDWEPEKHTHREKKKEKKRI